jgi:transposase
VINSCPECLKKQRQIDALKEENQRLKQKLRYRERKDKEGFFGSSTPSSKIPLKPNRPEKEGRKPKGARPGHFGRGRPGPDLVQGKQFNAVVPSLGDLCPQCGSPFVDKGYTERLVMESHPLRAEPLIYWLPKRYCPKCRRTFQPSAPGVLPKNLYGNQLMANAAVMHYLHGIPLGRVCEQLQANAGSLIECFHRMAHLFASIFPKLIEAYRQSPVKHADETGWRTDGINGYVWLFATETISLFLFRQTRSGKVPQAVLGNHPLPGILVVDRYAGYNQAPCPLQYCYAHLLRVVQDLEKEFPDSEDVKTFVSVMAPLLATAMSLRHQPISEVEFYQKAAETKAQIVVAVEAPALHLGIRHIQDLFRDNAHRLYHWTQNRQIPAENNLAERDLRPTVIARKVSFGSASDAGAHTRGTLMSILYSLKKQKVDATKRLKEVLDYFAKNIHQDPFVLLFPEISKPP